MRVEVDGVEVRHRERVSFERGGLADQRLELDPDAAQLAKQLLATAGVRAPDREAPVVLDVLHDRAAAATREAYGVHDDVPPGRARRGPRPPTT